MKLIGIIGILVIITIIAIIAYTHAKEREEVIRKVEKVDTYLDLSQVPDGTAPASIGDRQPYHALEQMETLMNSQLSSVTADKCHCADESVKLELMGNGINYKQMTNNYKRGAPDSCTAPRHELVGSFYSGGIAQAHEKNAQFCSA